MGSQSLLKQRPAPRKREASIEELQAAMLRPAASPTAGEKAAQARVHLHAALELVEDQTVSRAIRAALYALTMGERR